MRSPRLAALELRRFSRGKLPRLGLVALMLIPLLYGALYLFSFWDPYSRLDKIPVALVNEDEGATADGKKIAVGDEIAKKVHDSGKFDWKEVTAADAAKGIEDGTYYLSLTVPSDFSRRIASSSGDSPETGALQVRTNDANSYIVGSISKTIFSELRAKASAGSSRQFLDKIFVSFSDLHDQTKKAADGAGKVDEGLGTAKDKTGQLADGLDKLNDGSGTLHDKAGQLSDGAGKVNDGAGKLSKGAGEINSRTSEASAKAKELSDGAGRVAAGTQQLADKVNEFASGNELAFIKKHGKEIGEVAKLAADGTQRLADWLDKLPGEVDGAAKDLRGKADRLAAGYREKCSASSDNQLCPLLKEAADTTADAADRVEQLSKNAPSDVKDLQAKLRELHEGATMLAAQAPGAAQQADTAIRAINKLNAGAKQVSDGAGRFAVGLGQLANGTSQLADKSGELADGAGKVADGNRRLTDGAGELHNKLGTAADGAEKISGGLYKLKDGTNTLATSLSGGVDKIPDYDKDAREHRTDVMSDPVKLASQSLHKAPNYGTGLAPYFIPLSLWVGAMVAYMLLQPLGKRALAAGAPGWRVALGSWLPAFTIGVVQVLALMAVLHFALGLEMERAAGTIGFLLLATACFTAIIQFFGAKLGPAGRVLTLVVLMLQLTSAGGTYPVQTSPGFFSAIHPFLPMSYVVDGLRRLITGGDLAIVWQGSAVLAAYTLGALALTALAARSRQVVRMKDLHPELSL
ncbi:YhgE/Pip family protein [Streptomyces sp. NPDC001339]|uniref:YhgE/Pip family protein n=1 Tax=Streptomyces sp. NPDC001339 TaxID=3364563 RepID=UPI003688BAEF